MSSSTTTQQKKTMRRKTVASLSSSSSSNSSTATHPRRLHSNPSLSSASSPPLLHPDDLTLGLSLTNEKQTTLYVKVMMEGIPIGRKLDLRAHDGYRHLISTLQLMFTTTILWAEEDGLMDSSEKCHVLTYEDKEGDWMMLGDVPWEMFLTTVKRLKITRIDKRCLC